MKRSNVCYRKVQNPTITAIYSFVKKTKKKKKKTKKKNKKTKNKQTKKTQNAAVNVNRVLIVEHVRVGTDSVFAL